MTLSEMLLPEFDREMATTRKTLERIPEEKFDWKPHEKSMTLGGLSTHLSNIPSWAVYAITQDALDVAPVGEPPFRIEPATSRDQVLEAFDKNVASGREAIAGASDEHLRMPWSLQAGGNTLFTMPRFDVLRTSVMNHMIHHRAQLGVYLRLNDVPLPSTYGPSADEAGFR